MVRATVHRSKAEVNRETNGFGVLVSDAHEDSLQG